MNDRNLLAALRRVIGAAADPGSIATLEDLTTVQLAADDMEAAIIAYDTWVQDLAEPTPELMAEMAHAAGLHLPY